jgi:2-polyprenyl-6-methoxyphenol hydroxylase-like FAD-dependent oxidoreductase
VQNKPTSKHQTNDTGANPPGEMIVITAPALHTPKKWPGFMSRARQQAAAPETTVKKFDGTLIGTFPIGDPTNPSLAIYRSKLHKCLYEYALSLAIPMEFDVAVTKFFESESQEEQLGGVVLSDGRTLMADLVVAADGVGSKSWEVVSGRKEAPISSGFVLYRVTFPAAPALENPVIAAELGEGRRDRGILHAGPGAHVVSCLSGGEICWLMTCRVSQTFWSFDSSVSISHRQTVGDIDRSDNDRLTQNHRKTTTRPKKTG